MQEHEPGSSPTPPEEGMLEKASRRIEQTPSANEGIAAIAAAQELLAHTDPKRERHEYILRDEVGIPKGKIVIFSGDVARGVPEYKITLTPDGKLSGIEVDELISDTTFNDPEELIDIVGGRLGRQERFDAQGKLVDITVNTYDRRGKFEKSRREVILEGGRKRISIHEPRYDGEGTLSRNIFPIGEKTVQIVMGPDGRTIRSCVEEYDRDDGLLSSEIEDREQGIRHLYHRGPPGVGFNRTEPIAA